VLTNGYARGPRGEETLIAALPKTPSSSPAIIAIRAVFGRCADMTGGPAHAAEKPKNVLIAAISCEKSGVSDREEGTDARPGLLQRHQNR